MHFKLILFDSKVGISHTSDSCIPSNWTSVPSSRRLLSWECWNSSLQRRAKACLQVEWKLVPEPSSPLPSISQGMGNLFVQLPANHPKHLPFILLFFFESLYLVVAVHGDAGHDDVGLFFHPLLLRVLSAFSHLAFFLLLLFLWCKAAHTPKLTNIAPPSQDYRTDGGTRLPLFSCLFLSVFHLFFCIFNYVWFMPGWTPDSDHTNTNLVLLLQVDLILRVVAWFVTTAYLHTQFSTATTRTSSVRFPLLLRIWWTLFPLFSAFYLGIDLVYCANLGYLQTDLAILDSGSVLFGLFLAYAGLFGAGGGEENTILREPLLVDNNGTCPFSNASPLRILTFSWMDPLLSLGYRKPIDLEDVPRLADEDSTRGVFPVFNSYLDSCSQVRGLGTLSLIKALVLSTWELIAFTGACCLLSTIASFVGPYLIDYFVQYLHGNEESRWYEGYALVLAFVFSKIVECLSQSHWFFRLQQAGVRVRAVLVAIIYKKSLTLSSSSRQSLASGEIVNLISVDADRIGLFSWYMHDLWVVPVQVTLALLILYVNLGLASIAAFVATVVVMLANVPLGKLQENYQEKLMESKDSRMKATSEILRNMKILKLQAWEVKFLSKIKELRKKETGWLRKYVYTSATTTFFFWAAPTFVSIVTFGACMLMGIPLESGKVLSALATFRVLQEPIYNLPDTISLIIQTKVSLDRIASFLCLDDLQTDIIERLPRGMPGPAVQVTNGSFSWDLASKTPTLMDLNFHVLHGMRVAICGTVGSGKSTLLSCILGEVPKISGNARVCGTIAYVAQSPWIQSGKVEDNILFGEKMDRKRYELILEACSLKKDLEVLPFGDQTMIGERGINLSGGQKQRIQIARALYQDADIFLFDDPFSAVDAHTGNHLFKECLLGLLDTKTVIYVTHQVEFLPSADLILVIKNGMIQQAGKYHDLLDSRSDFLELVGAHDKALSTLHNTDVNANGSNIIAESKCGQIGSSLEMLQKEDKKDAQDGDVDGTTGKKGQLIQEEEREKGKVGFPVYWKYITASYRGALVLPILLAQVLFQILQIGSNYWITWASSMLKETEASVSSAYLIYVYVALAFGSSVCILVRAVLLVTAGYKSATLLFNQMHTCIFHAPMSFFDSTPSGRILNRASNDQSEVDLSVAYQIGSFAFSVIQMLGIIAVMSQVAWQVFAVFIPVVIASVLYQNYYIATARELSRLTGICKAPIIQHFAESLSGCTTIRSFNQETRFVNKNFELSDAYSRPTIHNAGAMEWLCFRLDILSCLTFAFALVLLISLPTGTIDPGFAGLSVTYGLNLNMIQSSVIWALCNLENKIVSVERILQYTCIPSEPPLAIDTNKPDSGWPSDGEVEIHNLQVRYAPHMPLVLKGLTCTFLGGKRTGIVGRTGSGKSTLIQTLFRLVDPAIGQILIDGIDISKIGLHDLRSKLSIIPQDPTMFEGTVRSNLDPLEEYSDAQIWEALHKCQLGEEVRRKEGKLDSAVSENGENWSVGQRQLVCLARVILKKNKVLVLDEATASVDTATDNLIQRTIREQFSDSTVITIAHRITSVLDSDMIFLLDNGIIAEHDHPSKLLENKSSLFAKLVLEYTMRSSTSVRS